MNKTFLGWAALIALGFVPWGMDRLLGSGSMSYYFMIWVPWTFFVYPDYYNFIRKWMNETGNSDDI